MYGHPQARRSLNWYTHQGATALMIAATQGNTVAVKVLLEAGAGGRSTAVHVAVDCLRQRWSEGRGGSSDEKGPGARALQVSVVALGIHTW